MGNAISDLNKTCATIRAHVATAKREAGLMLDEASNLNTQRQQIELKSTLLSAFTAHFTLTPAEISTLTSTAEPVSPPFFDLLVRLKQIHADSQTLLASEDQTLGLQILEQSTRHLDEAFDKLFHWTQQQLKHIDLENPHLSAPVRRAIKVLAERPALFHGCLDFFATSREQVLADAFYSALTGGDDAAKTGRSIELNAHDPLRYVSDMLAWVHAATVSEREALKTLFVGDAEGIQDSIRAGRQARPWLVRSLSEKGDGTEAVFDGGKMLAQLVDRDLSGVMRQLRQRLEQALYSHDDALLAYQIRNLVAFYGEIFAASLGPGEDDSSERNINKALQPVMTMAMTQFVTISRDSIANLHVDVTLAPPGLEVPGFLAEALEALKPYMKSYETTTSGPAGFEPVLANALDPYTAGCRDMANNLSPPASHIFTVNYLSATRATLKGPSYTANRVQAIDAAISDREAQLISYIHTRFVADSGLHSLLEALEPHANAPSSTEETRKVAKLRILRPEPLGEIGQRLDAFLPTAIEDAKGALSDLRDKSMVRRICDVAADEFAERFDVVERLLVAVDDLGMMSVSAAHGVAEDEDDPVVLLRQVFPRTSDEVRVLLS